MTTLLSAIHPLSASPVSSATDNDDPAREPLWRAERCGLAILIVLALAYGGLVVYRSAFLERPLTDLGCFLHAAWAVRTGNDIYAVTFNGCYYCYPPLLAILLVPLALPPAGADQTWMLPLVYSSAIWYFLNVGLAAWGVHRLAGALEENAGSLVLSGSRQWWLLRTAPIWACLVAIGSAQGHGQSNLLLLALACAMIAAFTRGQRFQAGLWMAGAICVKIFPLFLLIYPLWRRDWRCLAGCTVGLLLGLFVIPSMVFGPTRAMAYNRTLVTAVVLPALGDGADNSRAETLTNITATDTQSFMAMLHNAIYLDRDARPPQVSSLVFRLHLFIAATLTLLTLYAGGWNRSASAAKETMFIGMLLFLMMMTSPVCHLHYFPWLIPLLMGLIQWQWQPGETQHLSVGWIGLFVVNNAAHIMAHLREDPAMLVVRDLCLCSYVGLTIWLLGWIYLMQAKEPGRSRPLQVLAHDSNDV